MGDKVPADQKKAAEDAVAAAKKALEGSDIDAIKAAGEKLQEVGHKLAEIVYSNANAQQAGAAAGAAAGAQAQGNAAQGNNGDVVDADYEVVDDDNNKQN